jgi:hypothetical protein
VTDSRVQLSDDEIYYLRERFASTRQEEDSAEFAKTRRDAHQQLDTWLDELRDERPSIGELEQHVFTLSGAVDENEPHETLGYRIVVHIKTSKERQL